MEVLVTGCAGFIGSHVCEYFLRQGHSVVGIDNMNQFYDPAIKQDHLVSIEKTAENLGRDFVFYHADIRHADMMAQIFREHRPQIIIHLAAMAGVRASFQNPLLYEDVNQGGTVTLLEEAKKAGIKHFVFGSSSSVYGNNAKIPFHEADPVDQPLSPYAASKRSGELSCHVYHKIYGMSIVCLRFFTVYGPRQRPDLAIRKFTQLIDQGRKVPVFGDGHFARDFTYIDDILGGVYKAAEWVREPGLARYGIFNLGGSQTTSVNTLVELIGSVLGKAADKQFLPEQPGDAKITCADISLARDILEYEPKIGIEEGIKKFVEWFRQNKV